MTVHVSPVRRATADDADELMEICRALHAENGLFAMNEQKVRDMLNRAFTNQGAIVGASLLSFS